MKMFTSGYLVSTHVVCERLSAMQGLPECGMAKCLLILPRIPYFRPVMNTPLPFPKIEIWPELGTLSFDYPRIPPPPEIEIWPELATLSFDYPRITPPPLKIEIWPELGRLSRNWSVWRLITVSSPAYCLILIITTHQWNCGKVIFSVVCVSPQGVPMGPLPMIT